MANAWREEIEKRFNLKIVNEQFLPWGEFYWLELAPGKQQPQSTFAVVKVYPLQEQKLHTHAGYEEIIIGLEGELIHWCDEREIRLQKGQAGYIRSGGQHRILNESDQPGVFISIITPVMPATLRELSPIDDVEMDELIEITQLEPITEKFSRSVGLAVTLISAQGERLAEPKNLGEFCRLCSGLGAGDCAICSPAGVDTKGNELKVYHCQYGLTSFLAPIVINGRLLGFLGCGYELLAVQSGETVELINQYFPEVYRPVAKRAYLGLGVLTRNHLVAAAETLSLFTTSLVQLLISSVRQKQMHDYRLKLSLEKQKQAELESSLNEVRLRFLESQVNPHFLFNTLNTIAQMAEMEGASTVSALTYALSNLLRSSVGKSDSLISVQEELAYVEDYLFIQRTRFPNRFEVTTAVDEQVKKVKIPFMTLMVLVENAILHGFADMRRDGRLIIQGSLEEDAAVFVVEDNGKGIPAEVQTQIETINKTGFNSNNMKGIGLKNILMRLKYFYGDRFVFTMERPAGRGTKVVIRVPVALP